MSDVPVELIVAAFQDESGAEQALQELKAAKKEGLIKIDNAAILKKDADGKIHIKEAKDMGGGKGAVIGGVVGGVLGLIAGPAAIATAAIGATIGGLAAKLSDGGFRDDRLQTIAASLKPGSSAIVALIEHEWVDEMEQIMREQGADAMTAAVSADIAKQLEEGAEVAYSLTDTGDSVNLSRVAASDAKVEAGSLTVDETGAVRTRLVATADGIAADELVVGVEGETYEAIAVTGKEAVYIGAATDGEEGVVAVVTAAAEETADAAAEATDAAADAAADAVDAAKDAAASAVEEANDAAADAVDAAKAA
jgi:uncharacterized membrane protein